MWWCSWRRIGRAGCAGYPSWSTAADFTANNGFRGSNMYTRFFCRICTVAFAFALLGTPAAAQTYPNKPIHVIVPVTAGGLTDVIARRIAADASARMGQPW